MHSGFTAVRRRLASIILGSAILGGCAPARPGETPSPASPSRNAARRAGDPADARLTSSFRRVVLDDRVTRAHALDVASDGRVFFIEREGAVKVWDPRDRRTRMVGFIPVKAIHTSGLLGIALDPDFAENGWAYFYYSPYNDTENLLARYTIRDGLLQPGSRKVLLQVPLNRQVEGGHSAGALTFGPDGNLYLSTGDNTSPRGHGWGPIDERPGREIYDAQRSSANTWDLRGKILRIHPREDGTYDIPEGNLFPYGSEGRPEIYVMGTRNPFRISVDPRTGWLYWGDVGPDAGAADPERGPAGHDEFNQARGPGNFGWPYFVADNQAYREYDFEKEVSGQAYDPALPINDSPNNTGSRVLPPAHGALIWYPYLASERFPTLGTGGRAAMAGPVYRYDSEHAGEGALPATFDGSLFAFDFMRHWIQEVRFDERGDLASVERFLPEMELVRPMAMDVGPEGALYLIEWGESYEGWNNDDARLVKIEYVGAGRGSGAVIDSAAPAAPIRRAEVGRSFAEGVRFAWPLEGGVFDFGAPLPFQLEGETGGGVAVRALVGHDSHTHPEAVVRGAGGTVTVQRDETHLYMEDHFGALEAWREAAGVGDPSARVRLQPRRLEAEHAYSFANATRRVRGSLRERIDVRVWLRVGDGGNARYGPINLRNIDALTFGVTPAAGGEIEVRIDGVAGPLLARVSVPASPEPAAPGGPEPALAEIRVPVRDPGGAHELVLVFHGPAGKTLMDIDWIEFNGPGMMRAPEP